MDEAGQTNPPESITFLLLLCLLSPTDHDLEKFGVMVSAGMLLSSQPSLWQLVSLS